MWWLLLAVGCGPTPSEPPSIDTPVGRTIDELWTNPPVAGATITVRDAVVVSRSTQDGLSAYLQSTTSTRGLEVRAAGPLDGWPPDIGTAVEVVVVFEGIGGAPRGWLRDRDDVAVVGTAAVQTEPVDGGAPRIFTLARWPTITITSPADPTGRATTDGGFALDGRFGVAAPGPGSSGSMVGIVTELGGVALRSDVDFEGERVALAAVETTVARVIEGAHAQGDWVRLEATQATPWSRGGRVVVVQDETGRGLWTDVEGFGPFRSSVGDRAWWQGELRESGGVWRLRTWVQPEVTGAAAVVLSEVEAHGAVVERGFTELGDVDPYGERPVAEGLLDDRFVDLAALTNVDELRVAVDASKEASRYAVLPSE